MRPLPIIATCEGPEALDDPQLLRRLAGGAEPKVAAAQRSRRGRCVPKVSPLTSTVGRRAREQRLSDFLLWECADAEIIFTGRMWPDVDRADLEAAVGEFGRRARRFGALAVA